MLVLSRRLGEEIVIDGDIRLTVVAVHGDRVRLGITAPPEVKVDRAEVHERRMEFETTEPHPVPAVVEVPVIRHRLFPTRLTDRCGGCQP
jgi:carbon storage regulator